MSSYQVKRALKGEQFSTQYGTTLQAWRLELVDEAGQEVQASLNQKLDTPEPSGTLELELTETEYGFKAKKVSAYKFLPPPKSDDTQRSIVRQHSQHMAVLWAAHRNATFGLEELRIWIDWFEQDATSGDNQTPDAAGADGAHFPAETPPSAPSSDPGSLLLAFKGKSWKDIESILLGIGAKGPVERTQSALKAAVDSLGPNQREKAVLLAGMAR